MIKEMGEDFARHKADEAVNASRARVLRGGRLLDVAWAELRVGDLLYVQNRQGLAADVVLLASSDEHGVCYIETSGLDGCGRRFFGMNVCAHQSCLHFWRNFSIFRPFDF